MFVTYMSFPPGGLLSVSSVVSVISAVHTDPTDHPNQSRDRPYLSHNFNGLGSRAVASPQGRGSGQVSNRWIWGKQRDNGSDTE